MMVRRMRMLAQMYMDAYGPTRRCWSPLARAPLCGCAGVYFIVTSGHRHTGRHTARLPPLSLPPPSTSVTSTRTIIVLAWLIEAAEDERSRSRSYTECVCVSLPVWR